MRELRKLNNFNAVMAFFSALNLGSVSGFVTRCFMDLPDDLIQCFNSIRKLMDHSMNFKSYRETLEMAEPPCIPYLGKIAVN
jgi:son of sevenless-like protein